MKRFSLPIFSASAPSAMTLAIGLGLSAMSLAVQAQEKVLRIAMTAADIPRTLGQPDQRHNTCAAQGRRGFPFRARKRQLDFD